MTIYNLVLVEWDDSAQPVPEWSWLSEHTWEKAIKCQSVGWLVHDGDDVKAVAPNMGNMGDEDSVQVSGVIRIPARSVTRLTILSDSAALNAHLFK